MFFHTCKLEGEGWGMTFVLFFFGDTWLLMSENCCFHWTFVLTFIHFPFASEDNYDYNENSPIKDFTRLFSLVLIWLSSFKLKH